MILDVIPVIPPDLRPMVQLDGGRFATSDLNDLYRRVINRNNRLKQPARPGPPPRSSSTTRSACCRRPSTALFDNGRRGRPVIGSGQPSAQVALRHAQGQAGPLPPEPARQARRLLRPFRHRALARSSKTAPVRPAQADGPGAVQALRHEAPGRARARGKHQGCQAHGRSRRIRYVWDVLEEVITDHPVHAQPRANPAPSGHPGVRAGARSRARQSSLHPLVCTAFNADFDGDQMAVHVPLGVRGAGRSARAHAVVQQHQVAGTRPARSPSRRRT